MWDEVQVRHEASGTRSVQRARFAGNQAQVSRSPRYQITWEEVVAQGDLVALRWTYDDQAESGEPVLDTGISIYRFKGGRIAER